MNVLVQFDEPVRQADGNALTAAAATAALTLVRVGDGSSTDLAGAGRVSINNDKTVITIDPAAALVSGASYTVTLPANTVEDEQGNEQGAEQSATFTVDTAAPTVTFAPATGATAGPATNVTVTFTEAVRNLDNGDITDTNAHLTVELKKSDGTGADLAGSGQVSIDDANKVITIDPAADLAAGDYTVKLLANKVEDVADNAVVAASATFTVDASVPGVTFTPADGTTTGDVNVNVLVQFDEPVRQADGNALTAAAATAALTLVRVGSDRQGAAPTSTRRARWRVGDAASGHGQQRWTAAPTVTLRRDRPASPSTRRRRLVSGDGQLPTWRARGGSASTTIRRSSSIGQRALAPSSYTVTLLQDTVEDEQGNERRRRPSSRWTRPRPR